MSLEKLAEIQRNTVALLILQLACFSFIGDRLLNLFCHLLLISLYRPIYTPVSHGPRGLFSNLKSASVQSGSKLKVSLQTFKATKYPDFNVTVSPLIAVAISYTNQASISVQIQSM